MSGAPGWESAEIEAQGHPELYLADKLRAGVALETGRETGPKSEKRVAVSALTIGVGHWNNLVRVTDAPYQKTPYIAFEPLQREYQSSTVLERRHHLLTEKSRSSCKPRHRDRGGGPSECGRRATVTAETQNR